MHERTAVSADTAGLLQQWARSFRPVFPEFRGCADYATEYMHRYKLKLKSRYVACTAFQQLGVFEAGVNRTECKGALASYSQVEGDPQTVESLNILYKILLEECSKPAGLWIHLLALHASIHRHRIEQLIVALPRPGSLSTSPSRLRISNKRSDLPVENPNSWVASAPLTAVCQSIQFAG